ncbi:MAG: ATP-binding protein [Ignavibacteria bacterium]|nr:ATP-binding protein [Ignavibacteria bacterium]
MKIERTAKSLIDKKLRAGKVIVLIGARRVGKTFLLQEIMEETKEKFIYWNGEDFAIHDLLKRRSIKHYKNVIGEATLLIIDEAQHIPEIGFVLKLIVDSFKNLQIIVTGSSSFDISNRTGEPLTGRKYEIQLFPVSESEYCRFEKIQERTDNLRHRLLYGCMPELINYPNEKDKEEYLRTLVNSYLFKDILAVENIRNSSKIFNLVKLIAFQVGNEVSLEELGRQLSMSKNTVEKYLDLLSKMFILHKLTAYSKNLRKEIVKSSKYYFLDNGIRNAIIADFKPLSFRNDIGALWENYMISERLKFQSYNGMIVNNYFWRTYDQQEIDLVEEREGNLFAYEMKWNESKVKIPTAWQKAYPDAQFKVITQENYFEWIGDS